jgi:hypothetical protein
MHAYTGGQLVSIPQRGVIRAREEKAETVFGTWEGRARSMSSVCVCVYLCAFVCICVCM